MSQRAFIAHSIGPALFKCRIKIRTMVITPLWLTSHHYEYSGRSLLLFCLIFLSLNKYAISLAHVGRKKQNNEKSNKHFTNRSFQKHILARSMSTCHVWERWSLASVQRAYITGVTFTAQVSPGRALLNGDAARSFTQVCGGHHNATPANSKRFWMGICSLSHKMESRGGLGVWKGASPSAGVYLGGQMKPLSRREPWMSSFCTHEALWMHIKTTSANPGTHSSGV